MATFNDSYVRRPTLLLHPTELARREPLGMQRAIEDLKRQVSDARSSETNAHVQNVLSESVALLRGIALRTNRSLYYKNRLVSCQLASPVLAWYRSDLN
jgi:phosphoenolpyruvate carboxylase